MRHIVCRFGHGEGIGCAGGYLRSVLGPIDKVIACCGRCGQVAGLPVVVGSSAADRSAIVRVGRCRDGETLDLEMRHIVCRFGHSKGIGWACRYLSPVLCPSYEVVACCGRCGQVAGLPVIECSTAADRAAVVRVGSGVDGEALQLEMRYIVCRFFRHSEGITGIGRDLCSVLGPSNEIVTRGRRCSQCTSLAIVVSSSTINSATIRRIGSSGHRAGWIPDSHTDSIRRV